MLIEKNALTADIYILLREKMSFQRYEKQDVVQALHNTLFSVVIKDGERPVAIGRVVGDDKIVFFIKDVVVDSEYQHLGIGKKVMEEIMTYIREKGCPNAYVGLMAVEGRESFYEQSGFQIRETNGYGSGMIQFVNQNADQYRKNL